MNILQIYYNWLCKDGNINNLTLILTILNLFCLIILIILERG